MGVMTWRRFLSSNCQLIEKRFQEQTTGGAILAEYIPSFEEMPQNIAEDRISSAMYLQLNPFGLS